MTEIQSQVAEISATIHSIMTRIVSDVRFYVVNNAREQPVLENNQGTSVHFAITMITNNKTNN